MRWLVTLIICALPLLVAAAETQSPHRCSPDDIAIGGYDLVSYHQPGGPEAGLAEYSTQLGGLSYRFTSAGNRDLFLSSPVKYLPRYQGWCAATLAMGRLACPDHSNFKIEDGQLLLFELIGFTNGRTVWNSDPAGFRRRADANAVTLLKNR